jgi:hypothetical protein
MFGSQKWSTSSRVCLITDPKQMASYSAAEQIAEVAYEAVRTGKQQLRYLAGDNEKRSLRVCH